MRFNLGAFVRAVGRQNYLSSRVAERVGSPSSSLGPVSSCHHDSRDTLPENASSVKDTRGRRQSEISMVTESDLLNPGVPDGIYMYMSSIE